MPASKISWTDEAWNPYTWNCNKVSQGCKFCYAQTHAKQFPQNSAMGEFIGTPRLRSKAIDELRVTKPGTVLFVNTHSDTFHEKMEFATLKFVFQSMNQRPDLLFLLLTKRPFYARLYADQLHWTENIWLGTSIENMDVYGNRLVDILETPAKHRFVSFEPLLGPIVPDEKLQSVDWLITGGESGEYRRPFVYQWALDLQRWAGQVGIPFYHKQGSHLFPDQDRLLDGKEYRERPQAFEDFHNRYAASVAQQQSLF